MDEKKDALLLCPDDSARQIVVRGIILHGQKRYLVYQSVGNASL